jgi:ribosome-binding protein aMBF1 (putative translation factor)
MQVETMATKTSEPKTPKTSNRKPRAKPNSEVAKPRRLRDGKTNALSSLQNLTDKEQLMLRKFRARLRELRVAHGWSQADLEKKAGLIETQISQYEIGHRTPAFLTLAALAKALDCSVDTLMGVDG